MDSNPSILNVDDYQPSLYARTRVLRRAGFGVLEATTGTEAIRLLNERQLPLVLLDVNLPDMTGFEVCRQIRSTPAIAGTAILHISAAKTQTQHQVYGLEAGADSYLVEPVEPPVLIATVKAFLRSRQAEEALRRSNEDLSRFAYIVAHELNEPLHNIAVHSELLEGRLEGKLADQSRQSVDVLVQSARKMRGLVDDILRFSQASHVGIDVREIDFQELVTQVLFSLSSAIESTEARITTDALPVVVTDSRIERVLQNLVSNAIKYRRPGVTPEIHISARARPGFWVFSVRDNGIGIALQYQDAVFHLFRRLHGRDYPGNGIGLALAKKIVEANGGAIWVESEPGAGCVFYFTIPAGEEMAREVGRLTEASVMDFK